MFNMCTSVWSCPAMDSSAVHTRTRTCRLDVRGEIELAQQPDGSVVLRGAGLELPPCSGGTCNSRRLILHPIASSRLAHASPPTNANRASYAPRRNTTHRIWSDTRLSTCALWAVLRSPNALTSSYFHGFSLSWRPSLPVTHAPTVA